MSMDAEDILGIILVVRHALVSSTDNGQKHTGPTVQPDHLPIQVRYRLLIIFYNLIKFFIRVTRLRSVCL